MTEYPAFGAGLWHFASYVDRYATDGYAPAVSTLEMIDRAAEVEGLSAVDVPYPFTPGVTLEQVQGALSAHDLSVTGVTPEIYLRKFGKGAFTNPDPGRDRTAGTTPSRSTTTICGPLPSTVCASWQPPTPICVSRSNTSRVNRA
jgi:xylose isomerase